MMLFWSLAGLMVAVALLMVLPPLFGKQRSEVVDRKQQNIVIAKERLQELEAERDNGELSQEESAVYRDELEESLLDDVSGESTTESALHIQRSKQSAIALAVLVPIAAIGLYMFLGNPAILEKQAPTTGHEQTAGQGELPSIDSMVQKLAQRMESDPDDAEGWSLLAQSYMTIREYDKAAAALEQLYRLVPDEATVMLRYADALTMANGGRLGDKAAELIRRAIEIEPNHAMGLWLAGMVAEEEGNYQQAIDYWRRLEPLLEGDPGSLREVQALIRSAENKVAGRAGDADVASQVSGERKTEADQKLDLTISLATELAGQVEPDHTIFLIVRAVDGPPMPLVAMRKQVRDLPLELVIDDAQVMVEDVSLADFSALHVEARISKSGGIRLQSGDLRGVASPVTLPVEGQIQILINEVL